MPSSTGIDAETGALHYDWTDVQQSISKILRTPIGSRVMRRDFGSDLPDLVDEKMIGRNVLRVYSAAASAIAKWEPRFRMTSGRVEQVSESGRLAVDIFGNYYPRGHLGDYSIVQNESVRVVFGGR